MKSFANSFGATLGILAAILLAIVAAAAFNASMESRERGEYEQQEVYQAADGNWYVIQRKHQ